MIQFTNKELAQAQLAINLDNYLYYKNTERYFDTMPCYGLADSQTQLINKYIRILEEKDTTKAKDFSTLLHLVQQDNIRLTQRKEQGYTSPKVEREIRQTAYLLRTLKLYAEKY